MKSIDIYLDSEYNNKQQISKCVYYLNYKDAVFKGLESREGRSSVARANLQALYKALSRVKEPCLITIHSKNTLEFKNSRKSLNKDLIIQIQTAINKCGHVIIMRDNDTEAEFSVIDTWERRYKQEKENEVNSLFASASKEREAEQEAIEREWRELLNERNGAWTPGSGGY